MINHDVQKSINLITHDPAWREIIVARLLYVKQRTDEKLHSARTFEEFLKIKGEYEMISNVCRIFTDPNGFSDDGVVNVSTRVEQTT